MNLVVRQNKEKITNFRLILFHHLIGAKYRQVEGEDQVRLYIAQCTLFINSGVFFSYSVTEPVFPG